MYRLEVVHSFHLPCWFLGLQPGFEHCLIFCIKTPCLWCVREEQRSPRSQSQRGRNAVAPQMGNDWRCCHSHQVSWNTVSRLGFRQRVKFHVWPIHLDANPCALKVLSPSLLFFFPSAGAGYSRLQSWEVGSSRDWLFSVQTPSGRGGHQGRSNDIMFGSHKINYFSPDFFHLLPVAKCNLKQA